MTSTVHRERLTRLQARRVALAAQGFTERRPVAPTPRALARVVDRLGLFQIDSINIVARAHYVPLFSRIGAYPPALLDRAYGRAPRRLFEYWAHEASLVRVDLQPALRFRMAAPDGAWGNMGGAALHLGNIAEMKTGEGKTLVATLPAYLNALSGEGVHVVTVNDYLAKYHAEWMGRVYHFLGLTTGVILPSMRPDVRRAAYLQDVTYATNNELGFDYLRDNMGQDRRACPRVLWQDSTWD